MMRRIEEENDKKSIEKWGRFDTEEEKGGKQILWMISTGGFESHFARGWKLFVNRQQNKVLSHLKNSILLTSHYFNNV